jgi:hypothetical protein
MPMTVRPRYWNSIGPRHFALYAFRSSGYTSPPPSFMARAIASPTGPS